jgi:asparagine synthase (glutamine-hydrolysing)
VITWDGRLDNRADLISELRDSLTIDSTDISIVAAAYEKWDADCFAKLIGDWALSIWNPRNRSLILIKDPIGKRHLYYLIGKDHLTWSSILDPLILFAGRTFAVCEKYIAGCFYSKYPATHLTPYVDVHSVPPSSFVFLRPGKHIVSKYWDFDPDKRVRYRTDAEYEEHFRTVFAKAVQRRLRSDRPVLAELSGGMDSSSIVCMADTVIARGDACLPRLDTVSWYNDYALREDPFYFTKVEEKRARIGQHVYLDMNRYRLAESTIRIFYQCRSDRFAAIPDANAWSELYESYVSYVKSQGYRVTLVGIGGEEATGGYVPTPKPELQNLLIRARFFRLAHQLKAWAAKMRKAPLPLLWESARGFIMSSPFGSCEEVHPAPWLNSGFVARNRAALCNYPSRTRLFGPLPSFQEHFHQIDLVRRAMASLNGGHQVHQELLCDIRYPYLDRDLLEFAFAIPQEQLVGVGKRRFLMKRALVGIVPDELLNRKLRRVEEPISDKATEWPTLAEVGHDLICSSIGFVDAKQFLKALERARHNGEIDHGLKRALLLESWLRYLTTHQVLSTPMSRKADVRSCVAKTRLKPSASSQEFQLAE